MIFRKLSPYMVVFILAVFVLSRPLCGLAAYRDDSKAHRGAGILLGTCNGTSELCIIDSTLFRLAHHDGH